MCGRNKLLLIACFLGLLSYSLYPAILPGYSLSSSVKLCFFFTTLNIIDHVSWIAEMLNIETRVNIARLMIQYRANSDAKEIIDNIEYTEEIFNGIPVRVYKPKNAAGTLLPGVVFYHGGGWVMCDVASYHTYVATLCAESGVVFVSVEYRLAPEHIYPAALDDCVTATKYFLENSDKFGVDKQRVAVAGDSAGGNLATTVSLKLRDESYHTLPKLQVLIYPSLQFVHFQLPSMLQNANGPVLQLHKSIFFKSLYMFGNLDRSNALAQNDHVSPEAKSKLASSHLNVDKLPASFLEGYKKPRTDEGDEKTWNDVKHLVTSPYASPLLANKLGGLPPVFMLTCEYDVLRDDGFLYAARLKEEGVAVVHVHSDIGFHGILNLEPILPEARVLFLSIAKHIKDNL